MEPKLKVYDWKSDEFMLIDWYAQLIQSGDMAVTFTPDMRYMSSFLGYFRGRATLGYSCDSRGIYFACWIEPFLSGAFFGIWIREPYRTRPVALKLTIEAYDAAFQTATVLIGICKQEHLRELHEKLGYQRLATIPALWSGDSVDAYAITKDMWLQRRRGKVKVWPEQSSAQS
jgi:hypothetical protein